MPEISRFFGIRITMYYKDHHPPHFHAQYDSYKALIDIEKGIVLKGTLPKPQEKMVLAWCEIHRAELMNNWQRCSRYEELISINPLT
ncbi:MAG: DUF4160 domain-containing protein [Eubacterium sp.]|nr:DUF4160 domain-containing protein [Eubacterium sp.]